ncbi:MAG: sulfatase [Planctomycetota bacterium]|nr:sulfatase [Planctomycetota bacterium]
MLESRSHISPAGIAIALVLLVLHLPGCDGGPSGEDDASAAPTRPAPRRIVLVCLDTLRAGRLGCYGHHRDTSPTLDAFAAENVLFSIAQSQSSQTLISHKSFFTAKHPLRLIREITFADFDLLRERNESADFLIRAFREVPSDPFLLELKNAGYRTAAFTDNVWISADFGFDAGFDEFDESRGHFAEILPKAFRWLEEHHDQRFFLFLHTYDTHCPYPCREPYNSMFNDPRASDIDLEGRCGKPIGDRPGLMGIGLSEGDKAAIADRYDGGVASADAYMEDLFDTLRALNIYDETLIIVLSDHGESLGEHEQVGHGGLYIEQLMVPFLVKLPASWRIEPGVVDQPVALLDLMPTILDACGLPVPEDCEGRSLLPLVTGGGAHRRHLVAQTTFREGAEGISNPVKRAIQDPGRWLLIHDGQTDARALFDLLEDPAGLVNVADRHPEVVEELLAVLRTYDAGETTGVFVAPPADPISEERKRALESLGYTGDE